MTDKPPEDDSVVTMNIQAEISPGKVTEILANAARRGDEQVIAVLHERVLELPADARMVTTERELGDLIDAAESGDVGAIEAVDHLAHRAERNGQHGLAAALIAVI